MEKDQQFLETIIKGLVDNPDDVETERIVDEMGILIRLWVNKEDMGLVIGSGGSHAVALRLIMRIFGHKNKSRVNLKIEEPK